jgi:hypothetical protein
LGDRYRTFVDEEQDFHSVGHQIDLLGQIEPWSSVLVEELVEELIGLYYRDQFHPFPAPSIWPFFQSLPG